MLFRYSAFFTGLTHTDTRTHQSTAQEHLVSGSLSLSFISFSFFSCHIFSLSLSPFPPPLSHSFPLSLFNLRRRLFININEPHCCCRIIIITHNYNTINSAEPALSPADENRHAAKIRQQQQRMKERKITVKSAASQLSNGYRQTVRTHSYQYVI